MKKTILDLFVTDEIQGILKTVLIVLIGKYVLHYKFDFFGIVCLYYLAKIELRINRTDFYISKVLVKE
jgi:hypothetical protein